MTTPAAMPDPGARGRTAVPAGRPLARRRLLWGLALVLAACLVLALAEGSVHYPAARLWQVLAAGPSVSGADAAIVWQIRLPRVVLTALVGLSLGAAGAILQGLFRNPMADPYVIGVSSGAALGAVAALTGVAGGALGSLGGMLGGAATSTVLRELVPACAFLGALGTLAAVYLLARVHGRVPVTYLLLAGVAVSAFVSSVVSLTVYFHQQMLQSVFFWLLGGFAGANWLEVALAAPYVLLGLGLSAALVRSLNLMLAGEEAAHHLGLAVEREKRFALLLAALLTAAAVSVSGMIGFVGLVAPHVVRLLAGPDHRGVLPGAALLGAIFLLLADMVARTALSPLELPVGIVTALVGGPFFLYLLRARRAGVYAE